MQKSNTNQIKHDTYLLKMSTLHFQNNNYGEQTKSTISFRVVIKFSNEKGAEHQPLCVRWVRALARISEKDLFGTLSYVPRASIASLKGSANLLSPPSSFLFAAQKNSADRPNDKNKEMHCGVRSQRSEIAAKTVTSCAERAKETEIMPWER